jgi:hypothetical protein
METSLFEIQADHLVEFRQTFYASREVAYAPLGRIDPISYNRNQESHSI